MRPSAAEALKAAIRRSIPIVVALVLIGIVAMNAFKQLQGPSYGATAKVYHSPSDLSAALTNIDPGFIDPERAIDTALTLAQSREPYSRAADRVQATVGEVQDSVTVGGSSDADVIAFTASTDEPSKSIRYANAVATAYVNWRSDIQSGRIDRAIVQIQQQLRRSPDNRTELREQLNRLTVLKTLAEGGAVVIERASSAPQTSPAPVRDSLLGASLGFVIALLIAGVREAFNTRIRSESDVEDALNKPVLATIQTLPKRAGIVAAGRHESRWGDTYALLAANLMQIRGVRKQPTILAVTSSIAGEGKSTTAANLAVAMAMRGQRVILAEFDLRKPAVGRMFRIPGDSPGIIQIIDGQASVSSATWTVEVNGARPAGVNAVHPATAGNGGPSEREGDAHDQGWLRVVPAGGTERGARVARSPRVPQLLESFGANADVVILDTPPALATVEMAELSGFVDGVLVVVRHGRVTRRSLVALNRQSEGWRADIVGAVLTDSPSEEDEYYYYKS
jgi:succinoglycan biosynthesis transport protein ExoP